MKKLYLHYTSLSFVLLFTVGIAQGMEITSLENSPNLDTLAKDTLKEIGFFLDAQNIAAMRCVNTLCNKKVISQEELNKLFSQAVLKTLKEDDASDMQRWQRYVSCPQIFLNFLTTDKKNLARIVYAQCNFDPNTILDKAAQYGDMQGAQLIIEDYYPNDVNRAFKTALLHGYNDLAIMLTKYKANSNFICMTAAADGDMKLFDLVATICLPYGDGLSVISAVNGCSHSHLEECGHKSIINSLINIYKAPNINEALFSAVDKGREGMVIWLVTEYRSKYENKIIHEAISRAKKIKHLEIATWLESKL